MFSKTMVIDILSLTNERSRFFSEARGIQQGLYTDATGRMHPLLGSFPISLAVPANPSGSLVRFLFADEGLLIVEKFRRYLSVLAPLMRAIRNFEVLYASNSGQNFAAAREEFALHFAPTRAVARWKSFAGEGARATQFEEIEQSKRKRRQTGVSAPHFSRRRNEGKGKGSLRLRSGQAFRFQVRVVKQLSAR